MKKFIFSIIAILAVTFVSAQSTSPRFGTAKNQDNTYRALTLGATTVTPTSTLVTLPAQTKFTNIVTVASTSLSPTFTANVSSSYLGDQMKVLVAANSAGTRTITLSTNLIGTATTQTVEASKKASFTFLFDGSKWIETSRCVEP